MLPRSMLLMLLPPPLRPRLARPACHAARAGRDRTLARLELLEARRLLSGDGQAGPDVASARSNTISDPRGDFLPTYAGPHDPGLDVVAHQVTVAGDRVIFHGRMAGPIAPTQEVGGLYLFGVDRGQGTARFLRGTPVIGPNVRWDLVVRINPDGTGQVANQVAGTPPLGVVTPLDPSDIRIDGTQLVASVPLSVLALAAARPPEQWTYNLWPRNGVVVGQNQHVSDLAPDDGNAPVRVLSRDGSPGYGQFGPAETAPGEGVGGGSGATGDIFSDVARIADDVLGTGDGPARA